MFYLRAYVRTVRWLTFPIVYQNINWFTVKINVMKSCLSSKLHYIQGKGEPSFNRRRITETQNERNTYLTSFAEPPPGLAEPTVNDVFHIQSMHMILYAGSVVFSRIRLSYLKEKGNAFEYKEKRQKNVRWPNWERTPSISIEYGVPTHLERVWQSCLVFQSRCQAWNTS